MIRFVSLSLACALGLGCGGASNELQGPGAEPTPFDDAIEQARDPETPRVREGEIARPELLPVLDAGIGRFLSGVELSPSRDGAGEFEGFEIVRFQPSSDGLAEADLQAGDVVLDVNGESIGRPDQAFAVWESLREASELVVNVRRGEERFALRFVIRD